jgi:replicative DNA helicase
MNGSMGLYGWGDQDADRAPAPEASPRIPPHSLEAEQSVLGGLLLDNRAWDRVGDLITESDYYRLEHRLIYAAIAGLVNATKPADVITVFEQLQTLGKASDCGGMPYLSSLTQSVPSAANVRRYAEIVRNRSMQRAVITAIDDASADAWKGDDPGATVDRIATTFAQLASKNVRKAPRPLSEILAERIERINDLHEGTIEPGWPTPFASLNRLLNGGLRPGMLAILASRPGEGKTALGSSIGEAMAANGLPTLLLSQEMPDGELVDRTISRMGGIDYGTVQSGKLDQDAWSRLSDAVERGSRLPFFVDDQASLRLSDIRAKARAVKGLKVLLLDYLQLCASTRRDGNRNSEIEEISRGLKTLAKDMGIAVIALSQLNRQVEQRANKRPNLSDLRDSGAIEQDADVVMFLWPVRELAAEGRRIVGLGVDKNRQGKKGELGLDFFGAMQRWRESTADIRPQMPKANQMDDL